MLTHPGVLIVPAVLATAEGEGRTGQELLSALVAGYEVAPEFLQRRATAETLADGVLPLLDAANPVTRRQREGLQLVRDRLGAPGAADRVAELAAGLIR